MIALLAGVPGLALTTMLAVTTPLGPPSPIPGGTAVTARAGGDLYAVHCTACHGDKLQGTPYGPPLRGAGAADLDFQMSTGRMPLEVPGTEPMRGPPSFPRDQIDAIVAYVVAHGGSGPAKPEIHFSADLARGRKIFEEHCQSCHGATGTGAVAGFGWLAPTLLQSTRLQTAEAVRVGPGIMPKFGEHQIPQADLDALAAYAETLHHPDDRGGYSLASAGPVGEGLVAWVAGLGITIAVMFAVGETLKRR